MRTVIYSSDNVLIGARAKIKDKTLVVTRSINSPTVAVPQGVRREKTKKLNESLFAGEATENRLSIPKIKKLKFLRGKLSCFD